MTAVAVLLAVSGIVALAIGLAGQEPAPPAPDDTTAATAPQSPAPDKQRQKSPDQEANPDTLDYSAPVRIDIPPIDVSSSLVEVGLDSAGVMETPEPVDLAGWFAPSPPPGIPGATVIAGHVTWDQEPMVFFRLGDLRRGDRVEVEREDGVTVAYEVTRIGTFPKEGFPTKAVYDQPDRSELRLITCGGGYDEASSRYLANVIVWATIVDTVPPEADQG